MKLLDRIKIWLWYDKGNKNYQQAKTYIKLKDTLQREQNKKNPDYEYIEQIKERIKWLTNEDKR